MKGNWKQILKWLAVTEGSFIDHPADPGGPTNKGVTQRVYDAWRVRRGKPKKDVRHITRQEAEAIYKAQYWDKVMGDELPSGVDYAVLDFAVNSGVHRAVKFVQEIVGVSADGIMGHVTLAAIAGFGSVQLINRLCDKREAYVRKLKTYKVFGDGWDKRIARVRKASIALARENAEAATLVAPTKAAQGKADGPVRMSATMADMVKSPQVLGTVGSVVGSVATMASGTGPVQWALAAVLVLGAVAGVALLLRRSGNV